MMGPRQVEQGALFYEFSIDSHIPADHLLSAIDRFVDLSVQFCSGVRPNEAANCRPEWKRSGSLTEAASAVADPGDLQAGAASLPARAARPAG